MLVIILISRIIIAAATKYDDLPPKQDKMTILSNELNIHDEHELVNYARNLRGEYNDPVTFIAYWNGNLNRKHLYSIKSCYYFNILHKTNRKIILWLENNVPNEYNQEISKYAEIEKLNFHEEVNGTFMQDIKRFMKNQGLSYYADIVRSVLLYNYGGCWFDLDVYFLRSFDPLFAEYKDHIILYQWKQSNHPNNAIYISLQPKNKDFEYIIKYVMRRNKGFGFAEAKLHFNLPLPILVLPCPWFDASWKPHPTISFSDFFEGTTEQYTFDNFFPGSFCYHWHNQWNKIISNDSIFEQLNKIIDEDLKSWSVMDR